MESDTYKKGVPVWSGQVETPVPCRGAWPVPSQPKIGVP